MLIILLLIFWEFINSRIVFQDITSISDLFLNFKVILLSLLLTLLLQLRTPIKREKKISFVHDAVITPDYLTLYNHGTDVVSMSVCVCVWWGWGGYDSPTSSIWVDVKSIHQLEFTKSKSSSFIRILVYEVMNGYMIGLGELS